MPQDSKNADQSLQQIPANLPVAQVQDMLTPTFSVTRTATIPASYVTPDGQVHGDDWPLATTQQVNGITADGNRLIIASTSRQDSKDQAPRVTGSTLVVLDANNNPIYSVDFNPNGKIQGTGVAAGITMNPEAVANLSELYDNITDVQEVSGATLDRALDQFRRSSGIDVKSR